MAASISSLLIECLGLFNAQVARDELVAHDAEVPQSLWLDELGRLRVWAANIGAHQIGQSSLDYRLRDASHIKDQIFRLLERLQRLLVDLKEVLNAPPEEPEDQFSDDEDTTELEQIYNGFVEVISSLFQMSMLIRRPARHDRLLGAKKEDCIAFEPYDRQHVLEKYPRADAVVGDRLGRAISRRRADLKYRERHHAKLSQGINRVQIAGNKESYSIRDRDSTVFSETIATEYKEPNIQFDETGSHSGVSQTSYAPTLLEGGNAITVPPPPKESANEQPFECPYCFFITTIKNKRSWARHVFRDIMPYVCIFADCSTPSRLYDSRREWYGHLTDSHISLSNAGELHECALCREAGFSTLSLERHLGRHLEELALFALPRSVGDDEIDSDRSGHSSRKQASSHKGSPDFSSDEAEDEAIEHVTSGAERLPTEDASVLAEQKTEVEYPIKCICTYGDDDGNTVYCDSCETWQHIECYYPNQNVPELHLCADCEPGPLDRKAVTERQKYRREQPDEIVEAIGTDHEFDSNADDDFAMFGISDESDGGSKARDRRIWASTLRASQHPKGPPGNNDRLGSTRDSSYSEKGHADRPISRTPRQNTPVQDRDHDRSYFRTSSFHPQSKGGYGGEKGRGHSSGVHPQYFELYRFEKCGNDWTVADRQRISSPQDELKQKVVKRKNKTPILDVMANMHHIRRRQIDRLLKQKNDGERDRDVEWVPVLVEKKRWSGKTIFTMDVIIAKTFKPRGYRPREKRSSFEGERSDLRVPLSSKSIDKDRGKDMFNEIKWNDRERDPFAEEQPFTRDGRPIDGQGRPFDGRKGDRRPIPLSDPIAGPIQALQPLRPAPVGWADLPPQAIEVINDGQHDDGILNLDQLLDKPSGGGGGHTNQYRA